MIEIRVYDEEFNFIGIIENQTSLLWHKIYSDTGDFTLTAPITKENIDILRMNRIVWIKGKSEAGVIESIILEQTNLQNVMSVRGRFLECYLDRRLIYFPTYSGRTETAMRTLLTSVELPMIQLGEDNGFDETVTFQARYKNLLNYESSLAKSAAFGFRLRPDFNNKIITFEIYKGLDHSVQQYDRTKIIFSEEYGNITSLRRSENNQLFYNVCRVGGQGEDDYKTYVVVGDTEATGLSRREVYYEATDIQSNGMTWADYLEALRQRGLEILQESQQVNSLECTVLSNGVFVYGKDYHIGDIVTVKNDKWGVSETLRITEATEIYEHEIPTIEIILGTTLPQKIKWET